MHGEFTLGGFDAAQWREGFTLPMKFASAWVKHSPRAKGWMPRFIGRHCCTADRVFMRTKHGLKMVVEPSSLDIYTYIVSQGQSWDEHVVDTCSSVLGAGGVFYDIGASVGYIALEMAAQLQGGGAVIAFEPQPELARAVATSARLNHFDHLRVFDLMLGDHSGDAALHVGSHSVHASAIPREEGSRKVECAMVTLDSLVESGRIPPPSVIKMDVEGAELLVLRGAVNTIRAHQPHIIFESDENMDRYGYKRGDILDLLASLAPYGFSFVTADRRRVPLNDTNREARQHADVLASPFK